MSISSNKLSYKVFEKKEGDYFERLTLFENTSSTEKYDLNGNLSSYEERTDPDLYPMIEVSYYPDAPNQVSQQSFYYKEHNGIVNLTFSYNPEGRIQEINTLNRYGQKNGEQVAFVDDKPVRTYFKYSKKVTELTPNRYSNQPIPNLFADGAICPALVAPIFKPL